MSELKSCPFCGGDPYPDPQSVGYGNTTWAVWCRQTDENTGCRAMGPEQDSPEAAIEAWNRRTLKTDEETDDLPPVEPPKWRGAVPMVLRPNGNWAKVRYSPDGTIGPDVTVEEADAVGAWQFHMLHPASKMARAALSSIEEQR